MYANEVVALKLYLFLTHSETLQKPKNGKEEEKRN